tara:strand:- start:7 stop:549 length:543 start_codon:yes stop_codon:yes gene_type:complete
MATGFYTQKITSGDKTQVTYAYNGYKSMTFTNTHSAAVSITLYVTSQLTTDITTTGTDIDLSAGYPATTSSQAIVLSATAATSDAFLNERVYKSDGSLIGTCTTFTDGTHITFAAGLVNAIADAAVLFTGTRYTMLNAVEIPANTALQLHPEDFTFDTGSYNMYIDSSNASGLIDIITRY